MPVTFHPRTFVYTNDPAHHSLTEVARCLNLDILSLEYSSARAIPLKRLTSGLMTIDSRC